MRLVISASQGKVPQREACILAAREGFRLLERVARHRTMLYRTHDYLSERSGEPLVAEMNRSAVLVDDGLTPMAAVAGTIADGVADFLASRGMTTAIVNNGGDIAIRLSPSTSISVGLSPELVSGRIRDVLKLSGKQASWGIATSGIEGRSFTLGVASAATAISTSASIADAAATAIANASAIDDATVVRRPAEELDANTDIPGLEVTVQAGPFSDDQKEFALSKALKKAELLIKKNIILGASIVVDGKKVMTDFFQQNLITADNSDRQKEKSWI